MPSPSTHPSTNFLVLPTQPSDAKAVTLCGDLAFGPNSFRGHMFPPARAHLTPADEMLAWRLERFRKMLAKGDLLHFKCVPEDDHGKVVGYAAWHRPGHFKAGRGLGGGKRKGQGGVEGEVEAQTSADLTAQPGVTGVKPPEPASVHVDEAKEELPAAMDAEAYASVTRIMDEEREKIWGEESNYWYLAGLAVDPNYQGHGLARKMIEMGLALADADGLQTYLESTPVASAIYPRFGFEKVGEYGFFEGKYVCEFFIRQPGGSRATVGGVERP